MPILTMSDYGEIRQVAYSRGYGKEELQSLPAMPNKTTLLSVFQAAEDRTTAAFTLFRADMEAILGIPANAASLALARKMYSAYISWKLNNV